MFKKIKSNKIGAGFTLIELIIVTAIIALIATASMAVLNPFGQFQKARDSRVKSDLSQIQKALETYYGDNGRYPANASSCAYGISGNNNDGNDCIEWGKSWQPYMNVVPQDPTLNNKYVYYSLNGQTYYLYASLSRGRADPQVCNNGNVCVNVPSGASCGGICNFGVSSPNVRP